MTISLYLFRVLYSQPALSTSKITLIASAIVGNVQVLAVNVRVHAETTAGMSIILSPIEIGRAHV